MTDEIILNRPLGSLSNAELLELAERRADQRRLSHQIDALLYLGEGLLSQPYKSEAPPIDGAS